MTCRSADLADLIHDLVPLLIGIVPFLPGPGLLLAQSIPFLQIEGRLTSP